MRVVALLFSVVLAGGGSGVLAQPERGMGGVGILVFQDANYRGRNATFRDDVPDLVPYGLNDRISSLRVAPGESWEVCEDRDFGGRCQVFYGEEPNLQLRGWNDKISSMRRVRGGGGWRPPVEPPSWGRGLVLFDDRDFRGDQRVVTGAVEDMRSIGFNDRARSLIVPRGESWEVCVDNFFRNCRIVNSDVPDLGRLNMSRRISSVRPARGGGGFPPPAGRTQLTLYDSRNFRGRSIMLTYPMGDIRGINASSARVSGAWQLCDGAQFTGNCVVVRGDEPDLYRLGLRGRVRSARPDSAPW